MEIRADFTRRIVLAPDEPAFVASPMAGVERRMLDRIGGEVARATTIVRYAPGSSFSAHMHDGGEEFLVLDGVFSDASGDFPAGTYVRNPPGSRHAPSSAAGCTIFVKLRQFDPRDLTRVVIDTRATDAAWIQTEAAGVDILPLHAFGREEVEIVRMAAGSARARGEHAGGAEILVLDGAFDDENGSYPQGSWLRLPPGSANMAKSGTGCLLYVKRGHLAA